MSDSIDFGGLLDQLAERVAARVLSALAPQRDELLDLKVLRARYGLSPGTVRAAVRSGALKASRGPRQRLLVAESEVRRWLTSRPVEPRQRPEPAGDVGAWERSAEAALERSGGRG